MQRIMDEQYLTDVFPADNKDGTPVQAASAAVDTSSGAVRAIVGGRKYVTRRGLNRATQLRRQPSASRLRSAICEASALNWMNATRISPSLWAA